jgi:tight adherence protein C
MLVLSAALAGLAVGVVIYSVLDLLFSEESQVARRLKRLTEFERAQAAEVEPLALPFMDRVLKPLADGMRRGVRLLAPGDYRVRIGERLRVGGNPKGIDADSFLAMKGLAALVTGPLLWVLAGAIGRAGSQALLFGLVGILAGFFLPDMWLRSHTTARQNSIRRALPDMLDMLMISVEAGLASMHR